MRTAFGAALSATPAPPQRSQAARVFLLVVALALVGSLGGVAGVVITKRDAARAALETKAPPPPEPSARADPTPSAQPTAPAVATVDPPAPATGTSTPAARDAGPTSTTTAKSRTPPSHRSPARSGAKPGEGDEYGF
jgi:hypothetical protein